jgi:hypothetical protein
MLQEGRPLLTLNHWFYHWADLPVSWGANLDIAQKVKRARPGTIFLWDKWFCTEPVTILSYAQLQARPEWRLLWKSELVPDEKVPYLACFERQRVMQAAHVARGQAPD